MRVLKKILRSWEDFISYGSFREIKEDSGVKGSADNIISGFQKMLYWLHKISKMAQMISAAKDYARRALSDTVITREVQESSTTIMITISAKETRRN